MLSQSLFFLLPRNSFYRTGTNEILLLQKPYTKTDKKVKKTSELQQFGKPTKDERKSFNNKFLS